MHRIEFDIENWPLSLRRFVQLSPSAITTDQIFVLAIFWEWCRLCEEEQKRMGFQIGQELTEEQKSQRELMEIKAHSDAVNNVIDGMVMDGKPARDLLLGKGGSNIIV